jgi:cobalt-zinc-cadmium efflux system membrane fusion protein
MEHAVPGSRSWLAGALLLLGACQSSQAATEPTSGASHDEVWLTSEEVERAGIEVAPVQDRELDATLVTNGRVAFDDQHVAHVFSPVTGRVVRIQADLGQTVKRGTPLATIESPDVGDALSDVHKAQAELIAASHDYDRQRALRGDQAASEAAVERAEDGWRKARAEAERARQRANLFHLGQVDAVTQTYTLVAPIDGQVLGRSIYPDLEVAGQYGGGTAQELFTIGRADEVWVVGDLYESDIGRVHVGAAASVTVIGYKDRVFTGSVDWVSATLDPVTRTARVRCVLGNADGALRPEMYATIRVTADPVRALAIPREALVQLGEYQVAFVADGKAGFKSRFTRVPIDVETVAGPWLPVRHGVEAGQAVVVSGAKTLLRSL